MSANQLSQLLLQISLLSSEESPASATENSDVEDWQEPPLIQQLNHLVLQVDLLSSGRDPSTEELLALGCSAQNEVIPFPEDEPMSLRPQIESEGWSWSAKFFISLAIFIVVAIICLIYYIIMSTNLIWYLSKFWFIVKTIWSLARSGSSGGGPAPGGPASQPKMTEPDLD